MAELFEKYPLSQNHKLSSGVTVQSPYHVYNGTILLIAGTVPKGYAEDVLNDEDVYPVISADDKAFMAIWVCDFSDAHLDPHHELQFSLLVTKKRHDAVKRNVATFGKLSALNDDVHLFIDKIWNDTPEVIEYNTELLGLPVQAAEFQLQQNSKEMAFQIKDTTNKPLFAGHTYFTSSFSSFVTYTLYFGLRNLLKVGRLPWIESKMINPKGDHISENMRAMAYTANDTPALSLSKKNYVQFYGNDELEQGFQLDYAQLLPSIKFVYLNPDTKI